MSENRTLRSLIPQSARRELLRATLQMNLISAERRAVPDFLIIGAQKCGTTSLFKYLSQHPSVAPAIQKEIHFFDTEYYRGSTWYRAHFPRSSRLRREHLITGEASPYYIFDPLVPSRVSELVPKVKLIALLRNPIDRAYSHYQMQRAYGHETNSFEDVTAWEMQRLKRGEAPAAPKGFRSARYLERGIYARQLRNWLDVFPKEQLLIVRTEDFDLRTSSEFERVLAFLDLEPWEPPQFERFMEGSYVPMDPAVRRDLTIFYDEHNRSLGALLDENMDWELPMLADQLVVN